MGDKTLAIHGGTPVLKEPIPGGGAGIELIDEEEVNAAAETLRSKQLFRFGAGDQCSNLEAEIAAWQGVKYALFVNSGTSALICALAGLGVGPGDEVIVPGYTYIATAAAVVAVGAVPVIAEIDNSLGLDPNDVRAKITSHTKAIVPVHMQGIPCRLAELRKIADEHGLVIMEDCCQAVGASYKDKKAGAWGEAGGWSLNFFKTITCGEGGAIFTDDLEVIERAQFQSDPALPMWKEQSEWINAPFSRDCYRGNEITAAIARVQLRKLPRILQHCRPLKKAVISMLNKPQHYTLQHVDDPDGEVGTSLALIANTRELALQMAEALGAEGLGAGTAYNSGFPDRHIYAYWDSILNCNGPTCCGYPWKDPAYKGSQAYSAEMCPKTLDILSRSLRFGINMNQKMEHMELVAEAINKVDAGL